MFQKELSLPELVNLEEMQKIQDSLSETLGVTIEILSTDGKQFTNVSSPNRLCNEILPKNPSLASRLCSACVRKQDLNRIEEETNLKCPFGLDVFVIPIRAVANIIVAYVIVGPLILKNRKEKSEYEKDAQKAGLNLDELMDALIEINVFSYNKVYSINKFIKEGFSYIVRAGYHKKRLGEIAPEVIELDPLFSRYYEEKVLSALLNSCTLALDADSGSVMTVDKKTSRLHIKAAFKLDENVVTKTDIKLGESIAGIAAATAQPIILPKDEKKTGLSDKMKRRYIKSSVIIPFNKGNSHDVYGVINLNLVRKNRDFAEKDIALLKELLNMAGIALIPIKEDNTAAKDAT